MALKKSKEKNTILLCLIMTFAPSFLFARQCVNMDSKEKNNDIVYCSSSDNNSDVAGNDFRFNSEDDVAEYFKTPKKFWNEYCQVTIELRNDGNYIGMYFDGHFFAALGVPGNNKFWFGDYVKMGVFSEGYVYPVIIHLPDKTHPYEYIYFQSIKTATDRATELALGISRVEGWLKIEPEVSKDTPRLLWRDSATEPSPYIFRIMR